jgi:hypothetical protein
MLRLEDIEARTPQEDQHLHRPLKIVDGFVYLDPGDRFPSNDWRNLYGC